MNDYTTIAEISWSGTIVILQRRPDGTYFTQKTLPSGATYTSRDFEDIKTAMMGATTAFNKTKVVNLKIFGYIAGQDLYEICIEVKEVLKDDTECLRSIVDHLKIIGRR